MVIVEEKEKYILCVLMLLLVFLVEVLFGKSLLILGLMMVICIVNLFILD